MPHFAEIRVVRFGDGVPLEVRWEVGTNDEVIWEEEEEEENSETAQTSLLEGASEQAKSQDAPSDQSQIWIRVQRRRWADETDSNDDNDGETLASEAVCFLWFIIFEQRSGFFVSRLEAIVGRLDRLEAIVVGRLEAIASRLEAIVGRLGHR